MRLLLLAALAGPVGAQEPAALFEAAREAERAGDAAGEAQACEALVALAAGGRSEAACRERLAWLVAHQDPGGGWAGLQALEAARREAEPTTRRLALGAVAGDPSVAPAVRATAAAALGRVALDQSEPAAALALTGEWWPGEDLPDPVRRRLGRVRIEALFALGRAEEARAVEAALAAPGGSAVAGLAATGRRRELARSGGLLALAWGLVAAPLAWRGWSRRPRPRPLGLVPLAVVGAGGLALATAWEPAVALPMLGLLLALGVTHLLAAGGALALAERPAARRLFGAASAVATVGLALALMARTHLLGWLGL